ncbi:FST family protein [Megaselia abdita]
MLTEKNKSNYKYKRRSNSVIKQKRYVCRYYNISNNMKLVQSLLIKDYIFDSALYSYKKYHYKNFKLFSLSSNTKGSTIKYLVIDWLHNIFNLLLILTRAVHVSSKGFKMKYICQSRTFLITIISVFIALDVFVVTTNANACWLEQQTNGKCSKMYQQEISADDCCLKGSQFAYTEKNYTRSEIYFFTLFSSGVECTPCKVSCSQLKCGPQKKCAIRKGRPKCICSIECKSSKKRKLNVSVIKTSRKIRSLSREIYINTFNQRQLTKTTLKWNNDRKKSSRGISSKVKRTLRSSTLITAHIFDTTIKPKNSGSLIGNKKHKQQDYDQIFHQIQNYNKLKNKEVEQSIKLDFLFENKNISSYNNNNNNRNKGSIFIPSLSSLGKLKPYKQNININKEKQDQQSPGSLKFDSKFLEHETGTYHNNLWNEHTRNRQQKPKPHNPVCGNDGKTYKTECLLRKRACRKDIPYLAVAYRGHCRTSCDFVKCLNNLVCVEDQYGLPNCIACNVSVSCPSDNTFPINISESVCGVNGQTYGSTCELKRLACTTFRSIAIAYKGPCQDQR